MIYVCDYPITNLSKIHIQTVAGTITN